MRSAWSGANVPKFYQIVTDSFASSHITIAVEQKYREALECNPFVPCVLLKAGGGGDSNITPIQVEQIPDEDIGKEKLIALEIWDALVGVKQTVKAGYELIPFSDDVIQGALNCSRHTMRKIQHICGPEASLGSNVNEE
eukprot:15362417-Ditylum_brightwellii.AAC.1